jgi:hypothetical protein
MKANLELRLAVLEAKVKPPVIATWVDFMMLADDDTEVEPTSRSKEMRNHI